MKKYIYYDCHGTNHALANLISNESKFSLVALEDLIYESKTANELYQQLKRMQPYLLGIDKININKETDTFVRIEFIDCWNNRTYLLADFDEKEMTKPIENSLKHYYLKSQNIILNESELLEIYQFYQYESLKEYLTENYTFANESELHSVITETLILLRDPAYTEEEAIKDAISKYCSEIDLD